MGDLFREQQEAYGRRFERIRAEIEKELHPLFDWVYGLVQEQRLTEEEERVAEKIKASYEEESGLPFTPAIRGFMAPAIHELAEISITLNIDQEATMTPKAAGGPVDGSEPITEAVFDMAGIRGQGPTMEKAIMSWAVAASGAAREGWTPPFSGPTSFLTGLPFLWAGEINGSSVQTSAMLVEPYWYVDGEKRDDLDPVCLAKTLTTTNDDVMVPESFCFVLTWLAETQPEHLLNAALSIDDLPRDPRPSRDPALDQRLRRLGDRLAALQEEGKTLGYVLGEVHEVTKELQQLAAGGLTGPVKVPPADEYYPRVGILAEDDPARMLEVSTSLRHGTVVLHTIGRSPGDPDLPISVAGYSTAEIAELIGMLSVALRQLNAR